MGSHDPIACVLNDPCIHLLRVREHEVVPVLVLESIHHVLIRGGLWSEDEVWERFHGLFWGARRFLRC
jgi:hypothetical protein